MNDKRSSANNPRDPQQIRERLVWRAAVVMLLAITGWLSFVAFDAQERADELEAELAAHEDREGLLTRFGLSTEAVRRFEVAGIEAPPEQYLLEDLQERDEWLADQAARLKGPLVIDTERSAVLSDHWVFATVETETGGGSALLAYELSDAGELSWELLAYAADGE
ncbi:MAG: hypothetical protein LLP51_10675 [Halorhodospira halophila]|uniref:hypothetical protein n=1 Tax=Halorhodospira TaxID=85108 RepID=UPI0019144AF8|nr:MULTISPECIES: hypothetical protein [Halorhodospira]MBK5937470.1 hypothetical protein [Halorhodospira halophila]MBK5942781.1 hypothetical protein [Halorhodospira halophila]MCC3751844.1 hypothetical protein [Halorhodospira halophila]MCG5529121.1 hypothetical protein [Halorhodospira halophila]MCG5541211.1 hypothetical protein [Halorhodospira sp. M39old]